MQISINKELISFQNCFRIVSRLCLGKILKRFLFSNVSAGNTTLCCPRAGQHFARELGVVAYRVIS